MKILLILISLFTGLSSFAVIWPRGGDDNTIVVKSGDNQPANDKHFRWHSFQTQKMILGTDDQGKIIVYPFIGFSQFIHAHIYQDIADLDKYVFKTANEADSALITDKATNADKAAHANKALLSSLAEDVTHSKFAVNGLWLDAPLNTSPIMGKDQLWDYSEIGVDAGGHKDDILVIKEELPNGIVYEWQSDTALPLDAPAMTYLCATDTDTPVYQYRTVKQVYEKKFDPTPENHQWAGFGGIFAIYFGLFWITYAAIMFVFAAIRQYPNPRKK